MQPTTEVIIDGKLDEWKSTPRTAEFIDITGKDDLKPYLKTTAMLMWDSNYLYIAAEMEEPHLWATITERDQVIYYDNDFEIFLYQVVQVINHHCHKIIKMDWDCSHSVSKCCIGNLPFNLMGDFLEKEML